MRKQIEKAVEQESSRLARRESKNTVPAEETAAKALHRLSMIVAVRVGETVGVQFADVHPSESIKLSRGSAYGEDKHTVQTSKPIPKIGYFEMINKSKEFFCVKVLRKGGDQRFEVPRPSYIAGTLPHTSIFLLHVFQRLLILFIILMDRYPTPLPFSIISSSFSPVYLPSLLYLVPLFLHFPPLFSSFLNSFLPFILPLHIA